MAMHYEPMPDDIAQGSRGGLGFGTTIVRGDGRREVRSQRNASAERRYDLSYAVRSNYALETLKSFYLRRRGAMHSFPFKDWRDFHSSPTNPSQSGARTTRDQLLGTGTGSQTQFQLVKRYEDAYSSFVQNIRKPVDGTVRVWVNSVEALSGWTVSLDSGVVTFSSAPPAGHDVEASFEFWVPCRFDEDSDSLLESTWESYDNGDARCGLVEDVAESGGASVAYWHGGAANRVMSADLAVSVDVARLWTVSATTTGLSVSLPALASMPTGWPLLRIANIGSNAVAIKSSTGSTLLASLAGGASVEACIGFASDGTTKVWHVFG